MSSPPEQVDALKNFLDEAEAKLSRRLREACDAEAKGVASESASEIRLLEDSLLQAAMAAEQVLTVRRHLDKTTAEAEGRGAPAAQGGKSPAAPGADAPARTQTPASADSADSTEVREFTDDAGRAWRAWPVIPNTARAREVGCASLGEFQDGWICFEALDNSGRRRLPRRQEGWPNLPREELQRLLASAITVPGRKPARPDPAPAPDSRAH